MRHIGFHQPASVEEQAGYGLSILVTEPQRTAYLNAMGIDVWQRRTVDTGPRLWQLLYPDTVMVMSQATSLQDLDVGFRRLTEDIAVALGGDYARPMTGHHALEAQTESSEELMQQVLKDLPMSVRALLIFGEEAAGKLLPDRHVPCSLLASENYPILVLPDIDELHGSAASKQKAWRFLAGWMAGGGD